MHAATCAAALEWTLPMKKWTFLLKKWTLSMKKWTFSQVEGSSEPTKPPLGYERVKSDLNMQCDDIHQAFPANCSRSCFPRILLTLTEEQP